MTIREELDNQLEGRFSTSQIFNTDNFESEEGINHPCYGHYGVSKAFREFVLKDVANLFADRISRIVDAGIDDLEAKSRLENLVKELHEGS